MADIVERLRQGQWQTQEFPDLMIAAADEIERLRAENEKLREALQAILAIDAWAEENQRIYDEKEAKISGDDKRSL